MCIGTDQHTRIDALAELRDVDEQERLRTMTRGPLTAPGAGLSQTLIPLGARHGRRALGLSPTLCPGAPADFLVARLDPALPRHDDAARAAAIDALLVAGTRGDIEQVFIGGDAREPARPTGAARAAIERAFAEH